MRKVLLISISCAALAAGIRPALAGWTFCVGESSSGKDIWISSVFIASRDRDKLESEFQAYLRGLGVSHPAVQCPVPKDEKTDVVNAQTVAVEFHHKLGDTLHEVSASEFASKL